MSLLLLLAVSMLTFGAMNVLGDPLINILGPRVGDTSPEGLALIDAAKAEYNLDKPLPVRYALWAGDFVRGDFGALVKRAMREHFPEVTGRRDKRKLYGVVSTGAAAARSGWPAINCSSFKESRAAGELR